MTHPAKGRAAAQKTASSQLLLLELQLHLYSIELERMGLQRTLLGKVFEWSGLRIFLAVHSTAPGKLLTALSVD